MAPVECTNVPVRTKIQYVEKITNIKEIEETVNQITAASMEESKASEDGQDVKRIDSSTFDIIEYVKKITNIKEIEAPVNQNTAASDEESKEDEDDQVVKIMALAVTENVHEELPKLSKSRKQGGEIRKKKMEGVPE